MRNEDIRLLYIDLFCGAGGTSTGVERTRIDGKKVAIVIACVNHDKNAIASHEANHPFAKHYREDIRTLDLSELVQYVYHMRMLYPNAKLVLWASLECTNFSKAKGGQARDPDSRTLAEHLYRYIAALDPDYIQVENVEEFKSWGELDDYGKPISRDAGTMFRKWVSNICYFDRTVSGKTYNYDDRILNSADFGALTCRKRYFGVFAKGSLPISFPEPTHAKNPTQTLFGGLERWRAVREALELEQMGGSIFDRDKPYAEATLKRILDGCKKFGPKSKSVCKVENYPFLTAYYGNGYVSSIESPIGTITTKDRFNIIRPVTGEMIMNQYSRSNCSSADMPSGTLTTNPKQNVVQWILNTNYSNVGHSIDEPSPVITANRKWHYLVNPQYNSKGSSIDDPCFTLIARMDKAPPSIVTAEPDGYTPQFIYRTLEGIVYEIYEDDSPMTKELKIYMAEHGLLDIRMRMLFISEMLRIMGFGDKYILIGTKSEQKKYIGNAVEVMTATALCRSTVMGLDRYYRRAA